MSQESLTSRAHIEGATTALERALAVVVAHERADIASAIAQVRAEFASERRAIEADIRAANAELAIIVERIARAQNDFELWLADAKKMSIEARGEPGKDGAPGERGADGAIGERGREGPQGRDGRDGLPGVQGERGKDGRDGARDGLGVRQCARVRGSGKFRDRILARRRGHSKIYVQALDDRRSALRTIQKRRGIQARRMATYGGSTFVCLKDTSEKPEGPDWLLIVKHGLPGRNGKDGERGPPGPTGRDGRDLTQLGRDGVKYA